MATTSTSKPRRRATTRPLFVKLSPTLPNVAATAQAAVDAGADAITVVNTIPGLVIDVGTSAKVGAAVEFSGVPVSVTNVSAAGAAFRIALEAHDAHGSVVATDQVAVSDLPTGTVKTVWAFQVSDLTVQALHDADVSVSSVEAV